MPQHIAIAGAGIIGLTCAYLLSEAGHKVTIVARNFYGDKSTEWASPWAGALLAPHPDSGRQDLQLASLETYHHVLETTPESGVKSLRITEYYDDRPSSYSPWYKPHVPNFHFISDALLPPGATLGYTYEGLVVNPNDFLPWITLQLKNRGVTFIQRKLMSMQELKKMTRAEMLVNASGLGARELVGDEKVHSVRGQTMFVKVNSEDKKSLLHQATLHQGSHYTYAIPRSSDGGIILGGVNQKGDVRTHQDPKLRPDICGRVNTMTGGAFSWVNPEQDGEDIVGFRPAREGGLRVEREGDIFHAYGVGGLGYLYAFGIAEKVREFVDGKERAHYAKL